MEPPRPAGRPLRRASGAAGGVGRALVDAVVAYARAAEARCLWLETQNTNYPAVRFYERVGFRLCGFDNRFYDGAVAHETALFFALDLT